MLDSKNLGTLKATENMKTGIKYLARRCLIAATLFKFCLKKKKRDLLRMRDVKNKAMHKIDKNKLFDVLSKQFLLSPLKRLIEIYLKETLMSVNLLTFI